jgi:hypothetical protein
LSKPAPQSSRSGAGIRRHFADHADSHADDEGDDECVVSLVITATAEAISIARADTLVPIADHSGGRLALAVLLAVLMALVIASLGGLTAVMAHGGKAPTRRD